MRYPHAAGRCRAAVARCRPCRARSGAPAGVLRRGRRGEGSGAALSAAGVAGAAAGAGGTAAGAAGAAAGVAAARRRRWRCWSVPRADFRTTSAQFYFNNRASSGSRSAPASCAPTLRRWRRWRWSAPCWATGRVNGSRIAPLTLASARPHASVDPEPRPSIPAFAGMSRKCGPDMPANSIEIVTVACYIAGPSTPANTGFRM